MLTKISCPLLRADSISFRPGLNVILGDDDAKNSIGKSLALLIVDFAMGGSSFLKDKAGAINALGHHFYCVEFLFGGVKYFFKRTTNESEIVLVCNELYEELDRVSVDAYRARLKTLYRIDHIAGSFRSLVSPFSRIWNKGGLDPSQPLAGDVKESVATAIGRLISFFGRDDDIAEEKAVLDAHSEKKKLITRSMNAEIIPKINKAQYKANQEKILDSEVAIRQIKDGFTGALSAYEALFDQRLRALHQQKIERLARLNGIQERIERLKRDLKGVTPRLSANIALITEFFPEVNSERLEQVETFHRKIGKMVQKELSRELDVTTSSERDLKAEIHVLETNISEALAAKGTPDDLFDRVFALKDDAERAGLENEFYDKKSSIEKDVLFSRERLEEIYSRIFSSIEGAINQKLRFFNKVVYGPARNPSHLRIKSAKSYDFISPEDTGTGKSFAGLVGFDLSMLSLTELPFVIHDSVIYKNIEVPATRRILRILAAVKRKQIFLAFDEASKFGAVSENLLRSHMVLKLSHKDLLYFKDWRGDTLGGTSSKA